MTHRSRLKLGSIVVAVLWTVWMLWWSAPRSPVEIGILAVCGVLFGLGYHLLYGRWYRWHFARKVFPRKRTG
jgi:hypothetical protein